MASGKGSYNGAGCWKAVCRNWRPASLLNPRNAEMLTGPQVTEHMSLEVRSLNQDVSLREAGQHMQKWKGTHDEGTGHPAFSCDARWSHHRSHFGIEYSAVLLRRGLATG
jgi:hypothetical protein